MSAGACCPHCGHDEFFVKLAMRGTTEYRSRFDGKDGADNSEMHNGLDYVEGAWRYCDKCRKRVGRNPASRAAKAASQDTNGGKE